MRRFPENDAERQEAASKVRFGLTGTPEPVIVAFIQERFAPLDDAWNQRCRQVQNAMAIEANAADALGAAREAANTAARQLANSLIDPMGRIDHTTRQAVFGTGLGDLLKVNVHRFLTSCQDALVWLAARPNTAHDEGARLALEEQLPLLIAARDAHQSAQANLKEARSAAIHARSQWDAGYRKLARQIEALTSGDEWKLYLATFVDEKPVVVL